MLGLEHDGASDTYIPIYKFSYGFLLPNSYGTIMSYSDKGAELFSDPNKYFIIPESGNSIPLGSERADAVSHLNRVRYYMSQLHEMGTVENSEYPATPLAPVIVTPPVGYVPDTPAVDGYVIDYPISDAMMASTSSVTTYITIPKKGILSMPFTSQGSDAIGKFSLQEAVTYVSPALRVWVSLTPAGESVSNMLSAENALLLTEFRWTNTGVDEGTWGGIEPYTQYYFNVQHMDSEHPASVTKREVIEYKEG